MPSPWLAVPLADYEAHMSAPGVGQYSLLSTLFREVLLRCLPASVAVVGVAGGNGLEHVDPGMTRRVAGIDVNQAYLDEVALRYGVVGGLELHCVDMTREAPGVEPAELVHAALVFEHAGVEGCLRNTLGLVAPGGWLSVVLQLPSVQAPGVAQTPFESIRGLSPHFSFVDPAWFTETVGAAGFVLVQESTHPVPAGKAFWVGLFCRDKGRDV
ncbi:MAG: hypothetical protein SGI92_01470 [Bryobacteraceae bacterium]|nr:hypothetical protein [Bryobacteraceae bacterium]